MEDREIDRRLGEVFKRNAPSFDGLAVTSTDPTPAGATVRSAEARRRAPRILVATAAVLAVGAVAGVSLWQGLEHLGNDRAIVLITDAPSTSTTDSADLAALDLDGEWELRVDRQFQVGEASLPSDPLPESAYRLTESTRTLRVVISEKGAKVLIEGDGEGYPIHGTRASASRDRLSYDTDSFAGGRFAIWQSSAGLQAEETMFGSGVPIIHSYRGKFVKATDPATTSFDDVWARSLAAVNALGPMQVTVVETTNEHPVGDDPAAPAGAGTTAATGAAATAAGPLVTQVGALLVTQVGEVLDAPTGRARLSIHYPGTDSTTVADGSERRTVVQNRFSSSIPFSRYRLVSLRPPSGLPLPLWAGHAVPETEGYAGLLSAIETDATSTAKKVESVTGGRTLLTWQRASTGWTASFTLTLAAGLLPDRIDITGEKDVEGVRMAYTTRVEFQFNAVAAFQDADFVLDNPADPGNVDETAYELSLDAPRSERAAWGQYWLGPQVDGWGLSRAEHSIHQGSNQLADEFVTLLYTRPGAADSATNIQVQVRPADAEMAASSRSLAEQQVNTGAWTRQTTTVAGRPATVYSGPAEGLGGRVDAVYVFLSDAFITIDLWSQADLQTVLGALATLPAAGA